MSEPRYADPEDPQTKVRNMVYDFFYRLVRQGKTNAEIFRQLQSTDLPPISESDLNALRLKFKQFEQRSPERMAKFRQNLRVP
jgi:hypothetical protein